MQEIFNVPFGKLAGGVVCAHCGKLLADHAMTRLVLPFELGGDASPGNIVYLCDECDSSVGFTVNIQKAFPYISVKQCERIMDYMDSRLTRRNAGDKVCAMCGTEVINETDVVVMNDTAVPMCESCKAKLAGGILPYATEEARCNIKVGPFLTPDEYRETTDPDWDLMPSDEGGDSEGDDSDFEWGVEPESAEGESDTSGGMWEEPDSTEKERLKALSKMSF